MPHDGNYGPKSTDPKGLFSCTCPCGTEFRTNHPFQRYHSPACKRQAQNRRHYQRHGDQVRPKALQHYHEHGARRRIERKLQAKSGDRHDPTQ